MGGEPDALEEKAGIQDLQKFGDVNTLETLSGGNILLWDDIMAQSYERVFTKLRLNKDKRKFEDRYNELRSKQK